MQRPPNHHYTQQQYRNIWDIRNDETGEVKKAESDNH